MSRYPFHRINWPTSVFLMLTLLVAVTGVPIYLWLYGLDWFQVALFLFMFVASSMSITLGYHRLLSHRSFKARLPVKLWVLLFGSSAFEGSALEWCADHRRHHKFVDHDDDPYDITKGFFHAHVGWLLFKFRPEPPVDNVPDLQTDRWIMLQHRYTHWIGAIMNLVVVPLFGFICGGFEAALGALLIGSVLRVVLVQHSTFCINSFCHWIGRRPYSSRCTARDSWLMALITFGEGYHNYHHEFQHDYRNGVKPWQFDPTKWAIWLMSRIGLTSQLRRVPAEKIQLAEIAEQQRQLEVKMASRPAARRCETTHRLLELAQQRLQEAAQVWETRKAEYAKATEKRIEDSKEKLAQLRRDFEEAAANLRQAIQEWRAAHRVAIARFA
jgi:stearoyl-CoA desaturase (delta-9 desaturase)